MKHDEPHLMFCSYSFSLDLMCFNTSWDLTIIIFVLLANLLSSSLNNLHRACLEKTNSVSKFSFIFQQLKYHLFWTLNVFSLMISNNFLGHLEMLVLHFLFQQWKYGTVMISKCPIIRWPHFHWEKAGKTGWNENYNLVGKADQ